MPPKKSPFVNATSFRKGAENSNRFCGNASNDVDETRVWGRPLRSKSETRLVVTSCDAPLRLRSHSVPPQKRSIPPPSVSENWIVDEAKLLECLNGAMEEHNRHNQRVKGRNKGHTPPFWKS